MLYEFLQNNIDGIIVGFLTGPVVTGIITFIIWAVRLCIVRNSEYSGLWEQLIFPYGDDTYTEIPVKRDFYNMKHKKMKYSGKLIINISGTIQRDYPKIGRKWDMEGYLDGNVLTIIYQSQEGQKSRGCIYLTLYKDYEFRGFYLEEHRDGAIDKTPLILRKIDKRENGYDFSRCNEVFKGDGR